MNDRASIAAYVRWHAKREEVKHLRLHPDSFMSMFAEKPRDLASRIEAEEDRAQRLEESDEQQRKR